MEKFTNLYSLSKTLRFELKPEPITKELFDKWLREMHDTNDDSIENLFIKDKKIFKAYTVLKPILDSIHEKFIEKSLTSNKAKEISFAEYFKKYKNKERKNINDIENKLREKIGSTFDEGGKYFSKEISKSLSDKKTKDTKKTKESKKTYKCLMDKTILDYIEKNIEVFCTKNLSPKELENNLKVFKGFFTYFLGYNTNRENYYEYKKEQSTSIATRIVHENLPIFCNNIIRFESRNKEYIDILEYLKNNNITTQIKIENGQIEEINKIDDKIFNIEFFNSCFTQQQIEEYNELINKYNFLINLYNQAKSKDVNFKKIYEFNNLYKQIGCGKKKILFASLIKDRECELTDVETKLNSILTVEKLINVVNENCEKIFNNNTNSIKTIPSFIKFLKTCKDYKGIYISKNALNIISNLYFSNWHDLKDELKKEKICTVDSEGEIKLADTIELSSLFSVLDNKKPENLLKEYLFVDNKYKNVVNVDSTTSINIINLICNDIEQNIQIFNKEKDEIIKLKQYKEDNIEVNEEDKVITKIKTWFDSIIGVIRIIKYFDVPKSKMKGNIANSTLEQYLSYLIHNEELNYFKWYDLIRNYITKKPQDDIKKNKLKLNFGTSSLLGGWSDGQEKVKSATILKNNQEVYLCILKTKNIFDTSNNNNLIYVKKSNSGRLILKTLGFKTLAGKGFLSKYGTSYGDMSKKNQQKAIENLQTIIREKYVNKYPLLKEITLKEYKDKKIFDADIQNILKECYECYFKPIDWNIVLEKEKKGEIFLFKIHSKDFKTTSIGNKNLQTLYWKSVLKENSVHQLCAGAEIFMRNPLENKPIKHIKGEKLVNKRDVNKKTIPDYIYYELFLYANKKLEYNKISKQAKKYIDTNSFVVKDVKHEIIKDRRFYGNVKYLFHCPIQINYSAKKYKKPSYAYKEVNNQINDSLQEYKNLNFIGIDRGEKHLVYYCKINKNGEIIDCNNYDEINGTNYVDKLEEKSNDRLKAKKNWQTQNKIKDLKNGYISQVVHKIVDGAIKENDNINPNSYVVLEDLNTEMKRNRQKIEKQVYQKLEIALAKKMNFIVDKNVKDGYLGSVSKALQLTPPIENYQDIEGKKQFGVMLYTRANYTSITDPVTGWRKTIYLKSGSDKEIKKQILDNFIDFGFDGKDYFFKYVENNANKEWTLYSGYEGKSLSRFKNKKEIKENHNIFVPEKIDVVDILNKLFINFDNTKSYKEQIKNNILLSKINDNIGHLVNKTAWQQLKYVIDLIQQIRNSGAKNSIDDNFLCSPVRDNNGKHFDTRNFENNGKLNEIKNADANGAYNIARKGLIMDTHIKQWIKNGKKDNDLNLFISDEEWDLWLLDRKQWIEKLSIFASIKGMKEYRNNNK